jgi:multiple sugar transport system permease protein
MWHAVGFWLALFSSDVFRAGATILCLLIATPAYAASRAEFRDARLYRQFLLPPQILWPVILILGIFRRMIRLGPSDQLIGLVLCYAAFNLAFAVRMLQAYFRT